MTCSLNYHEAIMAKIVVTIEFENSDGSRHRYGDEISAPDRASEQSTDRVAQRVFNDLKKDLFHGKALDALPDADGLYKHGKQSFSAEKLFSSAFFDEMNLQTMWLEIENRMREVRFLLASAKGSKHLEPPHDSNLENNHILYAIHFEKMSHFDLAAFRLAKVEDLVLRLLFEGTAAELVSIERTDWESRLTWDRVKDRLNDRSSVERLRDMDDPEYERLMKLIRGFRNPNFVQMFLTYRDRLAHRITPSVDYPELYINLENRKWKEVKDDEGHLVSRQRGFGGLRSRAEFQFAELYEPATKTYRHYLESLRQLRDISIVDLPLLPID
jgi:hypothetical protein